MSPQSPASVDVLLPTLRRGSLKDALDSVERLREVSKGRLDLRVQLIGPDDVGSPGPAAARNAAARRGDAEFLALLDDDDLWLPARLSRSIALLRVDPQIALICGNALRRSGGLWLDPDSALGGLRNHRQLALSCFVCASTVTLRRADWEAAGGMDERLPLAEDYDLWLRLSRGGRRIHVIPEALALYQDGGAGLSADSVAMAEATLLALRRSAELGREDPAMRDRMGRLQAVVAHGRVKEGRPIQGGRLALRALRDAPGARVAWTATARALIGSARALGGGGE